VRSHFIDHFHFIQQLLFLQLVECVISLKKNIFDSGGTMTGIQ